LTAVGLDKSNRWGRASVVEAAETTHW